MVTREDVLAALPAIRDPDLGRDVVELAAQISDRAFRRLAVIQVR